MGVRPDGRRRGVDKDMHNLKRLAVVSIAAMALAFATSPAFADEVVPSAPEENDAIVVLEGAEEAQTVEEPVVEASEAVE